MKSLTTKLLVAGGLLAAGILMYAQQGRKPVTVTRLYTGPDGETHTDQVEVKFPGGTPENQASEAMKTTGVEIHRAPPGAVQPFHTAPRRQYVVTLSGRGEVEVSDGHKVQLGPGQVLLVEDTTGKGHITRALGTEDRVTMQIPLGQ